MSVVAIEYDRSREDRETLGALRQKASEQHLGETLGARQRFRDALHRVLVEVEARGAERESEIGDDDVARQRLRQGPRDVVADGRRTDATLGADERVDVTDRIGIRIVVEVGDAFHDLQRRHRRDQVFADAALQQLAVEHHVVGLADDDDLGAGVAALGQTVELVQQFEPRQPRFDDDEVRRRALLVVSHGRRDAAHVDRDVRLGEAPVLGRVLHRLCNIGAFTEALDGNARNWSRAISACAVGICDRCAFVVVLGEFPASHSRRLLDEVSLLSEPKG